MSETPAARFAMSSATSGMRFLGWMGATLDGIVDGTEAVFESKFNVALVVLGGGRGREVHGSAPAQHVGHQFADLGAINHHRGRQMGGNCHPGGPALSECFGLRRKEILALRPIRRATAPN